MVPLVLTHSHMSQKQSPVLKRSARNHEPSSTRVLIVAHMVLRGNQKENHHLAFGGVQGKKEKKKKRRHWGGRASPIWGGQRIGRWVPPHPWPFWAPLFARWSLREPRKCINQLPSNLWLGSEWCGGLVARNQWFQSLRPIQANLGLTYSWLGLPRKKKKKKKGDSKNSATK